MKKGEIPIMLPIKKITAESPNVKSYFFGLTGLPDKSPLKESKAGQFVMVWIPEVDEKPMSISFADKNFLQLTVACRGKFTNTMCKMSKGEFIGIRGPFGNFFRLPSKTKRLLLIGGGTGTVPLRFLMRKINRKTNTTIDFILGSKSKNHMLFGKEIKQQNVNLYAATNDGTYGIKGTACDAFEIYLKKHNPDKVFCCGPELMMYSVAKICVKYRIPCDLSLERYMKCGFGVCGQCVMGHKGVRVCADGPVLSARKSLTLEDFGKFSRNAAGTKIMF